MSDPKFKFNNGDTLRDTLTGATGTVTARTEWIYGCKRYQIQPRELERGKPAEGFVADEQQFELVTPADTTPVYEGEPASQPAGPRADETRPYPAQCRR